ncbi:zinc finger E-box-binding homeobox protein zag-1 isoform X2 [Parasteatoda tepidariorum]|uniref:zinc finger E-box-binding homeobox protein zag-1 isoform X2 n=1 Tax=Parasteatoda tepidariorum TaxID=114398 RepID=UPI0039BCC39E
MADHGCKRRKQANPRRKNVDLEGMPEDADADQHVAMRPSLTSPPLNTPLPAKGPLLSTSSKRAQTEDLPLTNGTSDDRPSQINGISKKNPEDEKIQEYLQRSDTAVIYPEPVGGMSPKQREDKHQSGSPEPVPVTEESSLKCPRCDKIFSGQQAMRDLKEHHSVHHKDADPPESLFTCQKCNASFTTKENLSKHKVYHVSNGQSSNVQTNDAERRFKCSECGKAFKLKHHLQEHLRIHNGEKPFMCPNCGRRFSHSGSFSAHNTSKKCLVVNLKVRKVDSRSPRGRGNSQNNSLRPIIPKYRSTGAGGSITSSAPTEMPLIPAGYMSSPERFSSFSSRPQQPYLPLTFPHPMHYLPMSTFPEVTQLLQQRRYENEVENHSQLPPQILPTSSHLDKSDSSPRSSPKPQGELNAVKKILEIVDNTVSKQQQSPTRPRNGLLSELLSAAPQSSIKSPPPYNDNRCRYCSRLFDSNIELHQHERYLCSSNIELRSRPESPRENGASETESCEDSNRVCMSPSALSVDCELTLKAHFQMNPRPKKSELIRLAHDLKCSVRTIQEWLQRQQMRSKDYAMNGNASPSPTPSRQQAISFTPSVLSDCNGHPFVPHYNGAISSCAPLVPFRPIPESPRLNVEEDQPLDLSFKLKKEDTDLYPPEKSQSPVNHLESEVLNLSQRSSRTPPKVDSPSSVQSNRLSQFPGQNNQGEDSSAQTTSLSSLHSSLLYKYMQMGMSGQQQQPREDRIKSPMVEAVLSPDHSPSRADQPLSMSSPGGYANNSRSPNATTGSYYHAEEPTDSSLYSPSAKKPRLWNQGDGEDSAMGDSPGPEEECSVGSSGKARKSWKLHKVEAEEGMYACDLCDKMFSKQSSLARHKYEHSGQRPHKCDICGKAFKHKHHLTEHKRLHSGEKPFQCSKCFKRFSHSGSYSQHMNHRFSYCKPYHE